MRRPLLKALVSVVHHEDGLLVRTSQTQTLLRGAAAPKWYDRLARGFDGTHDVEEFLAVLPPDRHSTFHSLIAALEQAGALRDAAMDDPPPTSDTPANASSEDALIAHLEQHTESPRRALAKFRAHPILVDGDYSRHVVKALRGLGTSRQIIGYPGINVGMANHSPFFLCLSQTYEEACARAQLAVPPDVQARYLCAGRCGHKLWLGPWPAADSGEACLACVCTAFDLHERESDRRTALPLSAVELALLSGVLAVGALAILTDTCASVIRPGERMTSIDRATMISTSHDLPGTWLEPLDSSTGPSSCDERDMTTTVARREHLCPESCGNTDTRKQ
jgi:hypothetical protein